MFEIKPIHRLLLWIILLLLLVSMLLFPVHLDYAYHPIESLYIFQSLPVFAALFLIWMLVLLLLLFSRGGAGDWEKAALIAVFAIGFYGFWSLLTPNAFIDGLSNIMTANYIQSSGTLTPYENVTYLDYPGIHLLLASLNLITGLHDFQGAAVLLVLSGMLFSVLLYLVFSRTLENSYIAAIATLMIVVGNFFHQYWIFCPQVFAITLLPAFLLVINKRESRIFGRVPDMILAIILLLAITMMHAITSVSLFFILLGIYIVQKRRSPQLVNLSTLALFAVVILSWMIYWAYATFGSIVGLLPMLQHQLLSGEFLYFPLVKGATTLGTGVPLWARLTRYLWLILLYVIGALLWLKNLPRLRKLGWVEIKEMGGLLGVALLGIIAILLSTKGTEFRRVVYIPFFTVPITIRFFMGFAERVKKLILVSLAVLLFVLVFPTFLIQDYRVCTTAFYPQEFAAGRFVKSSCGEEPTVFGSHWVVTAVKYYNLDAHYSSEPIDAFAYSEAELWQSMDTLVSNFENSNGNSFFILSPKMTTEYQARGFKLSDAYRMKLEQELQMVPKFYDNGFVQIYSLP